MIQSRGVKVLRQLTHAALMCGVAGAMLAPATAWAQPLNLGAAESFAVLAGTTVANTGVTTVVGDVGVGPGGSITGDPITVTVGSIHEGDAVAVQAQDEASEAYDALVAMTCGTDLTGQNLGGKILAPGVYCFDADAQLTGAPLTLSGAGPWIFQIGGALTTDASVLVPDSTQNCDGSSVFWQVGTTATVGTATTFVGNILAETSVALGAGAIVDGRVVALDPASSVTLNTNQISACSFGEVVPVHAPIKVTGGGQINVPDPDSDGFANYGFNAKPEAAGGATGHLNYRNHVTGLHVIGTVTDVNVVTINPDGSPKMVRFSGTCEITPACTFSVIVEDNGEPAVDDRFGITVVGSTADETTPDRVVKNGNIQFHLALIPTINADSFRAGEVMTVGVSVIPGVAPPVVDAYLVLRLPTGEFLSWTGAGFAPGIVPLRRNITPFNVRAAVARLVIPSSAPAGTYTWLSAFTAPGTLNLVSGISERSFRITR